MPCSSDGSPSVRRVGELLAEARGGRGRALVVSGEPGVGKSDLLEQVSADADGWLVLSARGVPAESDLPFSGLHQLLAPVLAGLDVIPAVQARALRGALGLGDPEPGRRLEVLAGTLSLLVAAANEQPVLLLIDDAHHLDAGSGDALGFVARRLHVGGIALIAAKRSDRPSAFDDGGFEELRLGGLELDEVRELLAGSVEAQDVVEQLWRDTGGNPLALTSLPDRLAAAELSGREPIVGPLPAATRVRRIYESRIFALPPETRRALLVAAASDEASMTTINDAVSAIGADPARLAAAEQAGIVTIRDGAIEFRDPLLRSAVYHDAPPDDRRAAHDALAGALAEERDADRRAWHRASAASAPDEDVALGLEQAALRARRRGGVAVEAMALARAARLTPDGERRAARLLAAARSTAHAGRLGPAAAMLEEALALVASADVAADIDLERARLLAAAGRERAASELLRRAADDVTPHDPARAARLLAEDALLMLGEHELAAAAASAERAAGLGVPGDSPDALALEIALAATRLAAGGSDAVASLRRACERGEAITDPSLVAWLAQALAAAGEGEAARPMLARQVEQHRVAGDVWSLQQELLGLADLELRAGQLPAALEAARETLQLADELGSVRARRRSLLTLALVEALLGREIDCREHVKQGLDGRREYGAGALEASGGLALGLLELSLARPAEAIAALEPVAAARTPGRAPGPRVAAMGDGVDRVLLSRLPGRRTRARCSTPSRPGPDTSSEARCELRQRAAPDCSRPTMPSQPTSTRRSCCSSVMATRSSLPAPASATASAWFESSGTSPRASCCARRSTASSSSAPWRGRSARDRRSLRVARLPAASRRVRSTCSRPRNSRSCGSSPRAQGTATSPRGSSSARRRSSTTCATRSASSTCARAPSWSLASRPRAAFPAAARSESS